MSSTFDDLLDSVHGPAGTPRRDRWDRRMRAYDILATALRPARWFRLTRPFATVVWVIFEDRRVSLRNIADALAFEYLGDFLFWGRPVTQAYADSWVSRIRVPRWMHIR